MPSLAGEQGWAAAKGVPALLCGSASASAALQQHTTVPAHLNRVSTFVCVVAPLAGWRWSSAGRRTGRRLWEQRWQLCASGAPPASRREAEAGQE
jgi:hypothetical protein